MQKLLLPLLLLLASDSYAQPGKKALFVIADGIPADVIESVAHPQLDSIAARGMYTRAYVGGKKNGYSRTPTISAVSYNSLLTGTWANKHNVWDNDIKAPNYHYPTIFRLFKDQFPGRKIGVYSSWTDNRTRLIGEGLPETGHIRMDYAADGFELDTLRFPHDNQKKYMHLIDEQVAAAAARSVREEAPDLSWVYLEYTDDMGHRYGNSEQLNDAVRKLDRQIGLIREAIAYRERQFGEDWLLIVTTDHGRDSISGRGHGGQSTRERTTWIYMNAQPNTYAKNILPAITDILPTVARHFSMRVPDAVAAELDGVALTGPVTIAAAEAEWTKDSVILTWKAIEPGARVRIEVAHTDLFKTGGKDKYRVAGRVLAGQQRFAFPLVPGERLYKIVLRAGDTILNTRCMAPEADPR